MKPCRPLALALAVVLAAAGCTAGSALDALPPGDGAEMASAVAERRGPMVEVLPPVAEQLPPLDPDARPATPLGALRARYFPIWTSDFDGAFPPDACGSAWELDGIARPVTDVDISLYGDARIMAALAVMRYEHLVSHALAHPAPLAQLCIAVGAVDPARAEALTQLAATIQQSQPGQPDPPDVPSQPNATAEPSLKLAPGQPDEPSQTSAPSKPSGYPDAVTIVASSPSAVLAVACNPASAGDPDSSTPDPAAASQPAERRDGTSVGAYLLQVAQWASRTGWSMSPTGSREAQRRPVDDCSALDAWASEWDEHVAAWIAEGQAWVATRDGDDSRAHLLAAHPRQPPRVPTGLAPMTRQAAHSTPSPPPMPAADAPSRSGSAKALLGIALAIALVLSPVGTAAARSHPPTRHTARPCPGTRR